MSTDIDSQLKETTTAVRPLAMGSPQRWTSFSEASVSRQGMPPSRLPSFRTAFRSQQYWMLLLLEDLRGQPCPPPFLWPRSSWEWTLT